MPLNIAYKAWKEEAVMPRTSRDHTNHTDGEKQNQEFLTTKATKYLIVTPLKKVTVTHALPLRIYTNAWNLKNGLCHHPGVTLGKIGYYAGAL
jgi:hypothetical protein